MKRGHLGRSSRFQPNQLVFAKCPEPGAGGARAHRVCAQTTATVLEFKSGKSSDAIRFNFALARGQYCGDG